MRLAAKASAGGQRLLVVGPADRLRELDRALWVNDPDSFLAHGTAGQGDEAEQPILLSEVADAPIDAPNGATFMLLLETGLPPGFEAFKRVLNLFDDGTEAHTRARGDWKAIGAREGVARSYWQQKEAGGWEKRG